MWVGQGSEPISFPSRIRCRWRGERNAPRDSRNPKDSSRPGCSGLDGFEKLTPISSQALIPVSERDHVVGSAEPRLTLVEYGDFGCPHCFAAKRPVNSLLERYDALRLVWRHFPDPELHPGADLAAELAELADVSGGFWRAYDLLLAGREQFTREGLEEVAAKLELEPDEVQLALDERGFRQRVRDDIDGGKGAGVHGTPTFFLNGKRLEGHWRGLAEAVPRMLAASEQGP